MKAHWMTILGAALLSTVWLACGCNSSGGSVSGDGGSAGDGGGSRDGGGGGGGRSLVLNPAFGDDGLLRAPSSGSTDWIWAAARAADGDILAAGGTTNGLGHRFEALVVRYASDGTLETSWGHQGFALLGFHDEAAVTGIEALDDGGAIVVGYSSHGRERVAFAARLDAKGALDAEFGTGGVTTWDAASNGFHTLALADDGAIFVLTEAGPSSRPALRRLTASGSIDETFGDGGVLTVLGAQPRDLLIQSEGKLLALAGGLTNKGFLTRVDTVQGVVDEHFGDEGTVETPFNAFAMALSPAGDAIAVVGGAPTFGSGPAGVLKLDSSGTRVQGFGTHGFVAVTQDEELVDVAWLSGESGGDNGDILVLEGDEMQFPGALPVAVHRVQVDSGTVDLLSDKLGDSNSNLWRLIATDTTVYLVGSEMDLGNGSARVQVESRVLALDMSGTSVSGFGDNGLARAASGAAPEVVWDMARGSDGSVVATGETSVTRSMLRFAEQEPDLAFGEGGFARNHGLIKLAIDDQGRILGTSAADVRRYLPGGADDTDFGEAGAARVVPDNSSLHAVALDTDKRIVAAGEVIAGHQPLVARLLADGSPDPSFGENGVVQNPGGLVGSFMAVLPEKDGLVLAGMGLRSTLVLRLTSDGTLDTSFGSGGATEIADGSWGYRLVRRRGGGYLVAGYSTDCIDTCSISLIALDATGTLDASFGEGGVATLTGRFYRGWIGMDQLADGSIVVGGAVPGERTEQLAVWRFLATGQLDQSFGESGVFRLPGRGRATSVVADGDGALVGGFHFDPTTGTGTDAVLLRFQLSE